MFVEREEVMELGCMGRGRITRGIAVYSSEDKIRFNHFEMLSITEKFMEIEEV
jgi:hypothetical protein